MPYRAETSHSCFILVLVPNPFGALTVQHLIFVESFYSSANCSRTVCIIQAFFHFRSILQSVQWKPFHRAQHYHYVVTLCTHIQYSMQ